MPTIIAAWTLGTWVTCLLVGLCGILVPYPRERPPSKVHPPLVVEELKTTLAPDQEDQVHSSPASALEPIPQPPAAPEAAPPLAPSMPSFASPEPEIALAVPIEVPAQSVAPRPVPPAARAASSTSNSTSSSRPAPPAPAAVRHLTFGVGEGAQPSPDYPAAAVNAGEQGNVDIRFTVDEAGKVASVELAAPSQWPLLNQSALRAIRERWRFAPGPIRRFDVVIQFQLNQQ